MEVNEILESLGMQFKETRINNPDKEKPYAIYEDSYTATGADEINTLKEHNISITIYSKKHIGKVESLETFLNQKGIEYSKDGQEWLDDAQLFRVTYTFSFKEKIRREN